jgi:hypothetical protein
VRSSEESSDPRPLDERGMQKPFRVAAKETEDQVVPIPTPDMVLRPGRLDYKPDLSILVNKEGGEWGGL